MNHKDMLSWAIMVKLIITIKALETLVTMRTSKRSKHRDIGNLGNEAHRDNSETTVTITLKKSLRVNCVLCFFSDFS